MNELVSFRRALMRRLMSGVGVAGVLATAGCGGAGGGGTGAGGGGDGGGGAGTGTTSATGTGSTATTTESGIGGAGGAGGAGGSTATGMQNVERCFPSAGVDCPGIGDAPGLYGSCTVEGEYITAWLSGPTLVGTDCCYQVDVTAPGDPNCGLVGRPFVVEGQARVAPLHSGKTGWIGRVELRAPQATGAPSVEKGLSRRPNTADLDARARVTLGREWARDAAYEHASVASFGKLALELLAFGAPADLVRAAHEAALDEVRHAEMGFALASAYLGTNIGPGPLAEAGSFAGARTLAELASAAVREGCVGETLAAVVAEAQRRTATDEAVREALAIVTEEESRHAELAFRVVAWAISHGGSDVRDSVHAAFVDAIDEARKTAEATADAPALPPGARAHGRLSVGEAARERLRAAEEVVMPAMACLLG